MPKNTSKSSQGFFSSIQKEFDYLLEIWPFSKLSYIWVNSAESAGVYQPNKSKVSNLSLLLQNILILTVFISFVDQLYVYGFMAYALWGISSVLFYQYFMQHDESRLPFWVFIKSACIIAVCAMPHILATYASEMWLYQIMMLVLFSNQHIIPFSKESREKLDPFLTNALLMVISVKIIKLVRLNFASTLFFLVSNTAMGVLLENTFFYTFLLFPFFAFAIVSGWGVSQLFNQKGRSFYQGLRYFIAGVCLTIFPLAMLNPYTYATITSSIQSYNVVYMHSASYVLLQTGGFVMTLLQTLYEEIMCRTLLYSALKAAGVSLEEKDSKGKKTDSQPIWKQLVMILLMNVGFAMAHMPNPVETGRQWLSLLEKFTTYFTLGLVMVASQVFSGGIELGWGCHFAHNVSIQLKRWSKASPFGTLLTNYNHDSRSISH
ncbi:MAG: CPBP family glutamic-type intramembrane protease, partial [Pseudomonadota bacterium]|nr:CPBP family glutamic-type intramembrane protease [Pseudomonadota bacterium]